MTQKVSEGHGQNPSNFSAAGPRQDKVAGLDGCSGGFVVWPDRLCNRLLGHAGGEGGGTTLSASDRSTVGVCLPCRKRRPVQFQFGQWNIKGVEEKNFLSITLGSTPIPGQRTHEVGGKRPNTADCMICTEMYQSGAWTCDDRRISIRGGRRTIQRKSLDIVPRLSRRWLGPPGHGAVGSPGPCQARTQLRQLGFRVFIASGDPSPPVPTITIILAWGRRLWSAVTAGESGRASGQRDESLGQRHSLKV